MEDLLYVVGQLSAGGQERQLCCLLQSLTSRGIRPSLVVWNLSTANDFRAAVQDLGVSVEGFSGNEGSVAKLLQFRQLVNRRRPRLVHSYSFYTNFAAQFAARPGVLALGSIRNEFLFSKSKEGPIQGRVSARWPRSVICNNRKAKEEIEGSGGFFRPSRAFLVRNGVDLDRFPARRESPSHLHILGLGRLARAKRWDLLLAAASRLSSMGLPFKMSIVGDGPLRQELLESVQDLGLQNDVTILGYQENVSNLLAQSSVLALSSDYEGCPNVVMEAMASGRAVVGTDVGDVGDLVDDGVTGFIVPSGDLDALTDRLHRLLSDPGLSQRMGEAGRSKAEREFGIDRFVDETLAVYRELGWTG